MAEPRLLQREIYIRVAGLFLILSPFMNYLVSVYRATGIPNRWSAPMLWHIAINGSLVIWALWISSLVIGVMMFKGRRSSWLSVLVVLALYVVYNVATLKRDIQSGWVQPVFSIAINVGLFVLVYLQEFHQMTMQQMAARAAGLKRLLAQRPPVVHFNQLGPWAHLIDITDEGLTVRAMGPVPEHIEEKLLEIRLNREVQLRLRFKTKSSNHYTFEFTEINDLTRQKLKNWVQAYQTRHTVLVRPA